MTAWEPLGTRPPRGYPPPLERLLLALPRRVPPRAEALDPDDAGADRLLLLFIVVFGISLGDRISAVDRYGYEVFIVPGLIAMAMAQQSYSNNASTIYQGRSDRFIDDVLAAPMYAWQMNVGYLIGAPSAL